MPTLRILAAVTAAAVCLGTGGALPASAAPSVASPVRGGGIIIINSSFDVKFVDTASCSITRSGFTAKAHGYGASLLIRIESFTGFHRYVLERGSLSGPYVSTFIEFRTPSGVEYASNFVPPFTIPNVGAIRFSPNGKLIGLGMHPIFDASGGSSVIVAGGMACH